MTIRVRICFVVLALAVLALDLGVFHRKTHAVLLVLLVVESTDILFAVDSIPAIFAATQEPMRTAGLRAVPVRRQGELVGMLTLENLGGMDDGELCA